MDVATKQMLKNELVQAQSRIMQLEGLAQNANAQASMPIIINGPVAVVPALIVIAQALTAQKEALSKLHGVLDKIIDKL